MVRLLSDSGSLSCYFLLVLPRQQQEHQSNDTIRKALANGISEGQKLIEAKAAILSSYVNGWQYTNPRTGIYGKGYLLNAATVLVINVAPNVVQEAIYSVAKVDGQGKPLNGANKYIIHFEPGKTPPINEKGYWSITMYNGSGYLVDNTLNRYFINSVTNESKYSKDGSLDIYLQHDNPGNQKESNWLPSPSGDLCS
jgi:hypothetical protein